LLHPRIPILVPYTTLFRSTFKALGEGKTLPKDEALAELARRYFISRGPATLADFVNWSGLLISEARAGLESIKSELVEETIDGQDRKSTRLNSSHVKISYA